MADMNTMSDNFVTGDNMYLRELQNFFFEVLGMMSITHYGCIGDGRTDNYPYLQVAIDDANRRGLNYLYVPYGIYRYRGELQNIGDLAFYGNPRARIINDGTGEEITVEQFGVTGGGTTNYNNLQNLPTINGTTLQGNKYSLDYNLQGKLTAGDGITINAHNVISATGGGGGGIEITALEENLIIKDGVAPTLSSGFYYTSNYEVIWKNSAETQTKTVLDDYEIFYYNADAETIFTPAFQLYYTADTDKWMKDLNCFNTDEIVDDNYLIPTSKAVYKNIVIHPLTENLLLVNGTAPTLTKGLYYTNGHTISVNGNVDSIFNNCIFYFDNTGTEPVISIVYSPEFSGNYLSFELRYTSDLFSSDVWLEYSVPIVDTLDNSTSKVPSNKAVYDALQRNAITAVLGSDYSMPSSNGTIPLELYNKVGNGFTINNNGEIVVGQGISYVKIQAQITISTSVDGSKDMIVYANSKTRVINSKKITSTESDTVMTCAEFIQDVSNGSVINLGYWGSTGDSIKGKSNYLISTYLTVEAIG